MANGSFRVLQAAIEAIEKDRFAVEISTKATGWLWVERVIDVGHSGVACIVPQSDNQQRIWVPVDEINGVRITKGGDALAPGHGD
ncbi:hypothetical protein [Novosphingobium huizhouense]|uniref:hypothetical protein n=1 Tax=Novosphingobium huizhouense TaxID=2866625 RepID=UPI001CD91018|nr:hypothetical protein [Novosphingobium huizhouense]